MSDSYLNPFDVWQTQSLPESLNSELHEMQFIPVEQAEHLPGQVSSSQIRFMSVFGAGQLQLPGFED